MTGSVVIISVVVAVALASQPVMAKAKYIMKYATAGSRTPYANHEVLQGTMEAYIEAKSQGQIEVEIYPSSQLGNFREVLEQVNMNTLESCMTTVGGLAAFFPEAQVTDLPYHLNNELVAEMFSQSPFWIEFGKAILEKTGNVRFITAARGGYRNFVTAKQKINTMDDLQGLKIRTINSSLQQEFVRALGANPTPIAWAEVYTSLETGIVDGLKNSAADVVTYKLPAKYVLLDRHTPIYQFIWVSDKWLKSLPRDLQLVVVEGIRQAGRANDNFWKVESSMGNKALNESGGNVSEPSAELSEALIAKSRQPMRDWFVEQYGDEWLKKFDAALEEVKAKIEQDTTAYIDY